MSEDGCKFWRGKFPYSLARFAIFAPRSASDPDCFSFGHLLLPFKPARSFAAWLLHISSVRTLRVEPSVRHPKG